MLIFDLVLATRRKERTGVERYGVRLFNAVCARRPDALAFVRDTEGFEDKARVIAVPDVYRSWSTLPWRISRLGLKPSAVVFPTAPASPLFMPSNMRLCRIIHDAFPWDRERAMPLKGRLLYRDVESLMARRYDVLLGTMEPVAEELRLQLGRTDIRPVGNAPGIDLMSLEESVIPGLPEEFILVVGTVEPRKNYEQILSLVESDEPGAPPVVLVGRPGWGDIVDLLQAACERRPGRLIWLRDLNDDGALLWLYRHAKCFLSLSKAEGFNMPLVESAMCGSPVICSDLPIHRAVAPPWARFVGANDSPRAIWELAHRASPPHRDALQAYQGRYSWGGVASRLLGFLGQDRTDE